MKIAARDALISCRVSRIRKNIKELTDKSFTIFPIAASRAFPAGLGKTRELATEVHSSPMTDLERRGDN